MMLLVLDKNPFKASEQLPKKYEHKQLLELMQMISCVVDFGYKQIPQGKEIKEWIKKNARWVYYFAMHTFRRLYKNLSETTQVKYDCILHLLWLYCRESDVDWVLLADLTTAIWRYSKEYESEYPTNSELPIEVVCELYKKYLLEFKGFGKKEVIQC